MSPTSAARLRRQYAGLTDSPAKQIGLRRCRDALALISRDDCQDRVADLLASAVYHLPYAKEIDRRSRDCE